MKFEKEFIPSHLFVLYGRDINTKKICEFSFMISAKGPKDEDGNYIPGVTRTYRVKIPADYVPSSSVAKLTRKNEEINREVFEIWFRDLVSEEQLNLYYQSIYDELYPTVTFTSVVM